MIAVDYKVEIDNTQSDSNTVTPLVSILVGTYNSSDFVLETLESAKSQTYQNIELIVTDDFSTDGTVEVCKNWIAQNKDHFVKAEVVEAKKNTGICANCNRGVDAAQGEWVKLIAGDDILLDTCISDFVDYTRQNKACRVVFGRTYLWYTDKVIAKPLEKIAVAPPEAQKDMIYRGRPGPDLAAPSTFFHKETLVDLGGFNTDYVHLEDLPLWAKFADNGVYLHFLEKFVTKYRIHTDNISGNRSKTYINKILYLDTRKYILNVLFPYYREKRYFGMMLHYYNHFFISWLIIALGNKNTMFSKVLSFMVLRTTFDAIYNKIRERMERQVEI